MFRIQIALLAALSCVGWGQGRSQPNTGLTNADGGRPTFSQGRQVLQPTPTSEEAPIFHSVTRLVQVDVIVKGKDAPIDGLTQSDFELKDNGKLQKIAVFSERKAGAIPPQTIPIPAGVIMNRPVQTGPDPVTTTIILMDWLNTPWPDSAFARLQALKYLDQTTRNESIAVYGMNQSFTILQNFTNDRAALRQAIEKSRPESPSAVVSTDSIEGKSNGAQAARLNAQQRQAEITSAAFRLLARHLKG
ncbi:MAG: VWA domain-containing protein, partial [Acidobacteriota bacterium]